MKNRGKTHCDNATSSWGGTNENDDPGMEPYGQSGGVNDEADIENEMDCIYFKWHPFGAFDCDRGYMVSARLSSNLMEALRAFTTWLTPCVSRCTHCCQTLVRGSHRISHSDSNRREHRGTIVHGSISIGGASRNDLRLEEDDDVQEEGQKTKTDPTILDAALRLLSGDIRRHDRTKGQMATDPVLRVAYRQYATQHRRFRGCAGFSSRVPFLGEMRTTIDKSHSRR
jgi:hypothetical protein